MKLSLILQFLTTYIHECLQSDKTLLDPHKFTSPKSFLYQLYFIISRLDEPRLAKMNYLVNFGVTMDNIRVLGEDVMERGGTYEQVRDRVFKKMEFLQILKIYKYFSWADKKLHQVFYIENKDDISEDLLADFKDQDKQAKHPPKGLNKGAQEKNEPLSNVIVK